MKILITGNAGFLGKKLTKALEAKGHTISGFDYALGHNILNPQQIDEVFAAATPDTCIHLAAVADLNFFRTDAEGCWRINVDGTKNVLEACKKYNTRMIFASTCCCYGNNECHPSDEESPLAPTEPYAESKKASEADVRAAGAPHTIMRLATFYGPGMRGALCPAVFLDKCHKKEQINIHGSGEQTRTFTYVEDIVSGIMAIAENDYKYDTINITTEEAVSVLQIAELAKKVTGSDVPCAHVEDRKGQIHKEHILNKRLKSLGWEPKTDFAEGMRLSYEDYKAAGGWIQSAGVSTDKDETPGK